jgi:hypothetical protein
MERSMDTIPITIEIPEALYEQLCAYAERTESSLDAVLLAAVSKFDIREGA